MKLQNLKILIISISLSLLLFTACSFINGEKYMGMYGDAIMQKNVNAYAKYNYIDVEQFNKSYNLDLYMKLANRVSKESITVEGNNARKLNDAIDDFRKSCVIIKVISFDEATKTGRIKVTMTDLGPKFLDEMNHNLTSKEGEEYNQSIVDSLISSFSNADVYDVIELDVALKTDNITGRYQVKNKDAEKINEIILGIR